MIPHLKVIGEMLCLPNGDAILYRWPTEWPEYDTFEAEVPKEDKPKLAASLYDLYECGEVFSRQFILPNGEVFDIDSNL